jgi:hypothetical protein
MSNSVFACDACGTVVFVPNAAGVTGGVCTQQDRGCAGEIGALDETTAALVRAKLPSLGYKERPWLTLVFGKSEQPS